MRYLATINVPGYLPMDDDPPTFETPAEAWWYLYHERVRSEQDAPCDLCDDTMTHGPCGDCDDDSETGRALGQAARAAKSAAHFMPDTVYGPTPGYRGDHDLGLAYCVTEVEDDPASTEQ